MLEYIARGPLHLINLVIENNTFGPQEPGTTCEISPLKSKFLSINLGPPLIHRQALGTVQPQPIQRWQGLYVLDFEAPGLHSITLIYTQLHFVCLKTQLKD